MIIVNVMQEIITWFPSIINSYDSLGDLHINWTLLAQQIGDSDLLGDLQKAFNNFIESGQVWALIIGLIIGYMIRGLTTYG